MAGKTKKAAAAKKQTDKPEVEETENKDKGTPPAEENPNEATASDSDNQPDASAKDESAGADSDNSKLEDDPLPVGQYAPADPPTQDGDDDQGEGEQGDSAGTPAGHVGDAPQGGLETASRPPATAPLDAPDPDSDDDDQPEENPSTADAQVESLRITQRTTYVRDNKGQKLNPDEVFSEPDQHGRRICRLELIEHTTATAYDRPIAVLLMPRGRIVSDATAQVVLNRITAEK